MTDKTKLLTCGDCKLHDASEAITCRAPLPIWVYNIHWGTKSKSPKKNNMQASGCACFKPRKDPP